jgi:hypothetical protein
MKKLLLALSTVFSLTTLGQSSILLTNNGTAATLAPNSIIDLTTQPSSNTNITLDIKNTSGSQKSYNAKRYDVILNNGADAYFCFAGTCYGPPTYSAGPITLNASQSASQLPGQYNMLVADLDEGPVVGISLIKYTFVNASNNADSVQVSLRYNSPTAINEVAEAVSSLDVFPNPATESATIKVVSSKGGNAVLTVYNALGATVNNRNIFLSAGKNKIDLNVESMPSGVYFANIKTGNNTVTKKFIVK